MFWHGEKGGKDRHKSVAMSWTDHQGDIAKLLGHKPVAAEPTLMDMFGFMTGMLGR